MTYRLRVCDLVTDQVMDTMPIQQVTYDDYIGKSGSLSGTIPVPDGTFARRVRDMLLPGRTMIYLERNGQAVWGGILWTRTPTRDERGFLTCPIQAGGLESYLRGHRFLSDPQTFTQVDQFGIAQQLIAYAQGAAGGNLRIEVDTTQTSGVLRTATYTQYDLTWIGKLLDDLAGLQNGFEWRIQVYTDSSGARHRALRLGYPKLTVGSTDLILSSPGLITSYTLPEDATRQANAWQSRGATINTNQATASYPLMSALLTTPADYTAGWPRLDGTSDYPTVSIQATLDAAAQADLARVLRPVLIPSVKALTGTIDPPQIGSYVRLRIFDDWYPDGLIARYRIVGYKVEPEERRRPEMTELYLEAA